MSRANATHSREARFGSNLGHVSYSALGVTGGLLCGAMLTALLSAMNDDAKMDVPVYVVVLMAGCSLIALNFVGLLRRGVANREKAGASESEESLWGTAREHLVEQVLGQLHQLQASCGEPIAARYASKLLHTLRDFRDRAELDPYTEIIMALYDALAFEDGWSQYDRGQYQGAFELLEELGQHRHLSEKDVETAIGALEDLGFNTTPFSMDVAR